MAIQYIGRDMITSPIPIQHAQHYSMGGIEVNVDGESSISGLLAAGETACLSVQGANRLGGNSVLETIVYGKRSGARAAELARERKDARGYSRDMVREEENRLKILLTGNGKENGMRLKRELGKVMNDSVGIFRTAGGVKKSLEQVRELRRRVRDIGINQRSGFLFNNELVDHLELENMTLLAEAIATCALAREESRGSHFRRDFPQRDDERWGCHSVLTLKGDGTFSHSTKPVTRIKHMPAVRTY